MMDTNTSIQTWQYNAGSGVAAVALSADGEMVVAGTLGKTVLCLDGTGRQRWQAKVGNQAWRVGLSANGRTAVVGTGSTRPWDMGGRGLFCFASDGSLRWQVDLKASVWGLALSADGETVAAGTDAKQLLLFDGQGHRLWQQDVPGLGWYAWVWSAALSADGETVVAGAADKRVRLFERSGVLLAEHRARADVFTVTVSANGEVAAAGDIKGYVYCLDRKGRLLWEERLADKVWAVVLSANGERLLVGAGEKEAHLRAYDQAGRLLWRRYVGGGISSLAFSADGRRAAAGTRDGGIYIFGEDGAVLYQAKAGELVRDVAISTTGKHVMAGSEDGYVYGLQLPPPFSEALALAAQEKSQPKPSGTVYNIHIEQAIGLAIGDGAQAVQTSGEQGIPVGESVEKINIATKRDQRCADLAESIRETLDLIKQYEDQRRLADDPKVKRRAEREIADLRDQLSAYEAEARELGCEENGLQEPIEVRYMTYLQRQYGHVPLGGIAPRVQDRVLSIPLDELFVPLQAEPDAPLQAQFTMSSVRSFEAVRMVDPRFVGLDAIMAQPRVVILGEPGAGKSTFLRWLVVRLLETLGASEKGNLSPEVLPIFVRLVNFAVMLEQRPGWSLTQYLRQWHLPDYKSLFETLLTTGRGWLLLDGLDEVADQHLRQQMRDAIATFAAQYPDFHIVVTSRIVGYRRVQFHSSFRHFTLQPFRLDEIALFVRNWYQAVYRLTEDVPDYAEAERRASRLLEGLKDKPRVLQLAGTPLLLAIIALMDWKGKEIPKRRVELYNVAIETLLEHWPAEQRRPMESELSMTEALQVLGELACKMFETGQSEAIRRDKLESRVTSLIQDEHGCSKSEARAITHRWLPWLSEHSGLLLDAGVDEFYHPVYAFLHLSFTEYLSGRALAEQWRKGGLDLAPYANDPRWREVVLLLAGHIGMDYPIADATRLVEEIYELELPHHDMLHQSLVLAAACLADDVQVAPSLRARILNELVPLWHRSGDGLLRSKLFRILAAMHGTDGAAEVIERIIPLMGDDRVWVRSSVLELLGKLGRPTDLELKARLLTALKDPDTRVQHATVRALETLGLAYDSDARAALLQALQQSDAIVRTRAALALSAIVEQDREVMLALLHTLAQDENAESRQMAARALSMIKQPDAEVLAGMLAALWDPNRGVRKEAAAVFAYWGEESRRWLIAELSQTLQDSDPDDRRSIARMMADIGVTLRPEATKLLLKVAEGDEDLSVRAAAIRGLGSLPTTDNRILRLLVEALASKSSAIRRYAAQALKQLAIGDLQISFALVEALKDSSADVRKFAAEALGKCGIWEPKIVHALEGVLSDVNEFVRLFASEALVEIGARSVKAQETLISSLRSNNAEVRRRAARELRRMIHRLDASVIAALVELVGDQSRDVREQALLALAELGRQANSKITAACRTALRDDHHKVRVCAAEALGKIGQADEATISDLLTALTDPNARVRLAASNALITLGEGPEREAIISRVRALLEEKPCSEEVLNTLWGLVVGES